MSHHATRSKHSSPAAGFASPAAALLPGLRAHLLPVFRRVLPRSIVVRLALTGLLALFIWAPAHAPVPHLTIQSDRGRGAPHAHPAVIVGPLAHHSLTRRAAEHPIRTQR